MYLLKILKQGHKVNKQINISVMHIVGTLRTAEHFWGQPGKVIKLQGPIVQLENKIPLNVFHRIPGYKQGLK